jgi:glycerol uptake facilitator-like aquaporin
MNRIRELALASKPSLLTKALSEFTGSMIFHFIGSVSPTVLTNAASLLVLVYYTARMSGAHLNPALTLTFSLLGYTNLLELVIYFVAQFSGAIFGALWIAALVPGLPIGAVVAESSDLAHGCFYPKTDGMTTFRIIGWEAVCTFCFILPIFSVVWYTQNKSGYGNTGPIIVGMSLYAAASACAPWTGGALNPARVVASQAVFRCPNPGDIPYYMIGEFLGAAVVPIAVAPWYGVSTRKEKTHGSANGGSGADEEGVTPEGSAENAKSRSHKLIKAIVAQPDECENTYVCSTAPHVTVMVPNAYSLSPRALSYTNMNKRQSCEWKVSRPPIKIVSIPGEDVIRLSPADRLSPASPSFLVETTAEITAHTLFANTLFANTLIANPANNTLQ